MEGRVNEAKSRPHHYVVDWLHVDGAGTPRYAGSHAPMEPWITPSHGETASYRTYV